MLGGPGRFITIFWGGGSRAWFWFSFFCLSCFFVVFLGFIGLSGVFFLLKLVFCSCFFFRVFDWWILVVVQHRPGGATLVAFTYLKVFEGPLGRSRHGSRMIVDFTKGWLGSIL